MYGDRTEVDKKDLVKFWVSTDSLYELVSYEGVCRVRGGLLMIREEEIVRVTWGVCTL